MINNFKLYSNWNAYIKEFEGLRYQANSKYQYQFSVLMKEGYNNIS